MNETNWIHVMVCAILALNFVAMLLACKGRQRWAFRFFVMGWLVSAVLLAYNWKLAQAPPFGNMHHVMCIVPLVLGPAYLYSWKVQKHAWLLGYFAGAAVLFMVGALCMPVLDSWRQMPALQSPWFVPHVAAYLLSYGLMTVATVLVAVSCWRRWESDKFMDAAHDTVLLGFPLMSFGLWSGAVWADAAWGGYWAWDIKEVWSLVTWGLYLVYFHIPRKPERLRSRRVVLFLAFAALLVTFLVVNLLPKVASMHSYAQ